MAKLDTVELFIEGESENHSVKATEYAVERGEPFTDHVAKKSSEFSISGYIISDDYEAEKENLKKVMNSGKVVTYVGKMTASNVIILSISGKHSSSVANGMDVSISLRRVRLTTTPWQKAPVKSKPAQKPPTSGGSKKPVAAKPSTSTVIYHVTKKGDTYWGLSKKYGSSIANLRTWNKYEDTKIPIGVKVRVE
jgi:LysM repeat protein